MIWERYLTDTSLTLVYLTQCHDLRYRTESRTSLLMSVEDLYDDPHSAQLNAHLFPAGSRRTRGTALRGAIEKREKSYRSWQLKLAPRLSPARPTSASSGRWGSSAPSGRRRAQSSALAGCSARFTPRRLLARRRSSPGSSAASRSSSSA